MTLYVEIQAAHWHLLLDGQDVAEIMEAGAILRSAQGGALVGHRAWRAHKLPVVRLSRLFGKHNATTESEKSIVCRDADGVPSMILDADKVLGIVELAATDIKELPALTPQLSRYFDGAHTNDNGKTALRFRRPLAMLDLSR